MAKELAMALFSSIPNSNIKAGTVSIDPPAPSNPKLIPTINAEDSNIINIKLET
jgi:hypothetical protein